MSGVLTPEEFAPFLGEKFDELWVPEYGRNFQRAVYYLRALDSRQFHLLVEDYKEALRGDLERLREALGF